MMRPENGGVFGVVLVGGRSRRMRTPKQLLSHGGVPLAAHAVEAMRPHVEQVVLAGSGPVPDQLRDLQQLRDPPGVAGPLAGVLAAMLGGLVVYLALYLIGYATNYPAIRPLTLLQLDPLIWGFAASLALGVGVTLATPPPRAELVAKYFCK